MALPSGTTQSLNGISYQERPNSCSVDITSKVVGKRFFQVAWADRQNFAKALMGYVYKDGNTPARYVRSAPQSFPGWANLFCVSVSIRGFGKMDVDSEGEPTYEMAQIDATYEELVQPPGEASEEDDVLATRDLDFRIEFLSYGGKKFEWLDGDKIVEPIALGKLEVTIARTYQRDNLPEIPEATIRAAVGKINSAEFDGVTAGYVLFTGVTSRKTTMYDGTTTYSITYNFLEKLGHTWNEFFNPESETYEFLTPVGTTTGAVFYESANFSSLF